MPHTYQHINSPYNNNTFYLFLKKFYSLLLLNSVLCFISFGQEEINPNGYNAFFYENGQISSEGHFKDGLPNGFWKNYYLSGTLKSVGFKLYGKSDSLWKFYDINGNLSWTYEYKNDLKNGCGIKYDSLGNKMIETYFIDGLKTGEEVWFYSNGSIKKTTIFKQGKETGLALEFNKEGIIITEEEYQNGYLRSREEFNRLDENGLKIGVWREYFQTGSIKSEIAYKAGKMDGISKSYDEQGKLIDINHMENGDIASDPGGVILIDLYKEYHSNGKVKLIGGFKKGLKSGIFREYNTEGTLIKAYVYTKDTIVAEGLMQPGGIFEGEWITYYRKGGIKSKGSYNNGIKEGKWIFYYKSGEIEQEGRFKENILRGKWSWYYQNGQLKKTEFFNSKGLLEGEQIEYDTLGNELSKGEYYNGKKEGAWFYEVGDYKEVGSFISGQADGVWKYYYKNGELAFIGLFNDGEPKGKHIFYHKNGLKKIVGKYAGGLKHGVWKEYSIKGELIETIQYKRGELFKLNGFKLKESKT